MTPGHFTILTGPVSQRLWQIANNHNPQYPRVIKKNVDKEPRARRLLPTVGYLPWEAGGELRATCAALRPWP